MECSLYQGASVYFRLIQLRYIRLGAVLWVHIDLIYDDLSWKTYTFLLFSLYDCIKHNWSQISADITPPFLHCSCRAFAHLWKSWVFKHICVWWILLLTSMLLLWNVNRNSFLWALLLMTKRLIKQWLSVVREYLIPWRLRFKAPGGCTGPLRVATTPQIKDRIGPDLSIQ